MGTETNATNEVVHKKLFTKEVVHKKLFTKEAVHKKLFTRSCSLLSTKNAWVFPTFDNVAHNLN